MKPWLSRTGIVLAMAAVIHLIVIIGFPRVVMRVVSYVTQRDGIAVNTLHHAPRVNEEARGVVRPSPDLVYSFCNFDLSDGPLRIQAPVPDTYWSLSLFKDNTDNFFVINDRQVQADRVDYLLVGPDSEVEAPSGVEVIQAPTNRGALLFRLLVMDESRLEELVEVQRQASCGPFSPTAE